jgi:hypothetical protein
VGVLVFPVLWKRWRGRSPAAALGVLQFRGLNLYLQFRWLNLRVLQFRWLNLRVLQFRWLNLGVH